MIVIIGAIAELERNLIKERVKAGMRRARFEGRRIGREPLNIDSRALLRDRERGMSLTDLAKSYRISRASVCRMLKKEARPEAQAPLLKEGAENGSENLAS